jgi:hypothetical protein
MKTVIAALVLVLGSASFIRVEQKHGGHVVLPNPKLLGCRASVCSQLWADEASRNAVYPRQVIVDIFGDDPCPLGLQAIYEKSVPLEALRASIDDRFGKWALPSNATSPVKLWRVEPEKFAIQLSVTEDRTKEATSEEKYADAISRTVDPRKRSNVVEGGMGQVIYIAFTNAKCSSQ